MNRPTAPPSHRERYRNDGVWNDRVLTVDVEQTARRHPRRLAVADAAGRWSYHDLARSVAELAAGLLRRGVRHGDVVAVMMPACREFVAAFLAVERVGGIVMPLIPSLDARDLAAVLRLGEPRLALTVGRHRRHEPARTLIEAGLAGSVALDLGVVAAGGDVPDGVARLADLACAPADLPAPPSGDDLAELAFTSGTTGEPKGVFHTHNTSLAGIRSTIRRQRITSDDVVHVALPVGHNFGYFYGVRLALAAGASLVLQARWDVDEMLDVAARHGVTVTSGTPTHLVDLLAGEPGWKGRLETLRLYTVAGAPCPTSVAEGALQALPGRLSRAFGMTEIGHVAATGPDCPPEKVIRTEGRLQPEVDAIVFDDDGAPLSRGQDGEVAFGGPFLFVGYVQGHDFTSRFFTEGFFRTGDIGHVDEDGYVHIRGRKKDVIIRGGENIPVIDVESALYEHPGIADVAVVGRPHPRLGETAVACIKPRRGARISLEDVQRHLEDRKVTRGYWPEAIHVLDTIPRNPTGKILRAELQRLLAEGQEHGTSHPGT